MRIFDLERECNKLYTKEIMDYVNLIHEYKGKQQLYIESEPDILKNLLK